MASEFELRVLLSHPDVKRRVKAWFDVDSAGPEWSTVLTDTENLIAQYPELHDWIKVRAVAAKMYRWRLIP